MSGDEQHKQASTQQVEANGAEFSNLSPDGRGEGLSLDHIMDISMPVTVELGRASMTVQQLLRLGSGSVVELDRMAGESLELYVRNVKFARGEVVVVDNKFGLRITEILDRKGSIEQLG